jgi:hypothetical protein
MRWSTAPRPGRALNGYCSRLRRATTAPAFTLHRPTREPANNRRSPRCTSGVWRNRQRNSPAPTRLRSGLRLRLALRPTIPARERFYADTRFARRGNAPSRQTGSTGAGPVSERCRPRIAVRARRQTLWARASVGPSVRVASKCFLRLRAACVDQQVRRSSRETRPRTGTPRSQSWPEFLPLAEKSAAAGSPLRARGLDRVRLHAHAAIVAKLGCALVRERVQDLAAEPRVRRSPRSDPT